MADASRKPMLDRLSALVAGPFLLGRKALSLDWAQAEGSPPGPPPEAPARITVKSPEHAIKRRG
jgi:hypothetical protein